MLVSDILNVFIFYLQGRIFIYLFGWYSKLVSEYYQIVYCVQLLFIDLVCVLIILFLGNNYVVNFLDLKNLGKVDLQQVE